MIEWLAEWFGDKHGLTVAVDAHGEVLAASERLRVFLFQAVRELLLNAIKPSGSMETCVILSRQVANLTV